MQKNSKKTRLTGALAGVAVAAVCFGGLQYIPAQPAYAVDLPTWEDVQRAKENEAAGAAKVAEIKNLLVEVEKEMAQLQSAAEAAAQQAQQAQQEFEAADSRHQALAGQAENSKKEATLAADSAASVVAQMYRSGGVDRNLELFLNSDAASADALLSRLSLMSKASERTTSLSENAYQAANTASALTAQAEEAAAERQRLYTDAETKWQSAAKAVEDTRLKQQQTEEKRRVLEAQLAALQDDTVQTVAGYEERLRIEEEQRRREEEERRRRAAAEAEAARRRAEEAAAAAQQSGGGGGGGGAAPSVPTPPAASGSWSSPLGAGSYYVSCHYGCYFNHQGIDLAAGPWTPIYAASAGQVTWSGWNGGYGNLVMIDHGGGVQTRYGHMIQAPAVSYGQWVGPGQLIGYVGSTGYSDGPHLHYETRVWGTAHNPYYFMGDRGIWL